MLVASGDESIENGGIGEAFIFAFWFVDFPLVLGSSGVANGPALSLGLYFPLA